MDEYYSQEVSLLKNRFICKIVVCGECDCEEVNWLTKRYRRLNNLHRTLECENSFVRMFLLSIELTIFFFKRFQLKLKCFMNVYACLCETDCLAQFSFFWHFTILNHSPNLPIYLNLSFQITFFYNCLLFICSIINVNQEKLLENFIIKYQPNHITNIQF